MFRKTTAFSLLCICIAVSISVWAWQNLPDIERFPVHWNASGVADRYGSRNEVLFNLSIMPLTGVFVALIFYFIPKIEPMQKNLSANSRAYTLTWAATMALLTLMSFMIAKTYVNLSEASQMLADPKYFAFGISLFFIFLGNIMGKIRQNFMFGVRTPWTLSSDISWEKTHRIAGRLFVANGLVGLTAAIFLPADVSILTIVGLILTTTVFCFIYSYQIWKNDPDKRQ